MPTKVYEKDEILNACFELFALHGYEKTSTAMLAEAAGVSKALIFHHFKSKKKLYISVLERCFDEMASDAQNEAPKNYQDFFEAKEDSGAFKIDYMQKHPKTSKLLFEAFYTTPNELKSEIEHLKKVIEEKYKENHQHEHEQMKHLFGQLSFKQGVNPMEAFELITIVSEHFRKKLASEMMEDQMLFDDEYWSNFLSKKKRFIEMIRYGIENKED